MESTSSPGGARLTVALSADSLAPTCIHELAMTAKRTPPDLRADARLIHIRLTPDTHKRLRSRAAEEDVSIQDWVEALIETSLAAPKTHAWRRDVPQ